MTAVAEGAALFAESIDWSSQSRGRKSNRGKLTPSGQLDVVFSYTARTPETRAKIIVQLAEQAMAGTEFQVDSLDTGWTSGRLPLTNGAVVDVTLSKNGESTFKVFVFDASGGPIAFEQDKVIITRTAATVDAIPASYSIGIEVKDKLGGKASLDWLIRAGDSLPVKGRRVYKSEESLKAGSTGSINFKLWEGEIEEPPSENRLIGAFKITGADFDEGVIPAGADLHFDFEMLDSGNIVCNVLVPCIGGAFHSGHNFYSRTAGALDYTSDATRVAEEGEKTLHRLEEINEVVDHPKLDQARDKLESVATLDPNEPEIERTQEAMEKVLEARRLLAQVRREHLKEIRQLDLDRVTDFFNKYVRQYARASEETAFDNLARTAQRSIDRNDKGFESHLEELRGKNFTILWRQDWFVVKRFQGMASSPHHFSDRKRFEELVAVGAQCMEADDIDKLRQVVGQLWQLRIDAGSETDMLDVANIIRG